MKENGFSYETIRTYKRSLKATFYTAIRDDYIRKNPFGYDLEDVIPNDTKHKKPLSPDEEKSLLDFIKQDKICNKHYDFTVILLGTGLRVSELGGLTVSDINFDNRTINVDHQVLKNSEIGYYINAPKTDAGIRKILMSENVYQAFLRVNEARKKHPSVKIDGYKDFLFVTDKGYPQISNYFETAIRRIEKKYNKLSPIPLSTHITPHLFRHTFCTNLANAGINPKALQYIMGHSSIKMTLDYYSHASFDSAKIEMERLFY